MIHQIVDKESYDYYLHFFAKFSWSFIHFTHKEYTILSTSITTNYVGHFNPGKTIYIELTLVFLCFRKWKAQPDGSERFGLSQNNTLYKLILFGRNCCCAGVGVHDYR